MFGVKATAVSIAALAALALSGLTAAAQPAPRARSNPTAPIAKADYPNARAAEARSQRLCEAATDRVWVQHDQGTSCIAYYATPATARPGPTVLYFEGDVPAAELAQPNFEHNYLVQMRKAFQTFARQTGVRYVFIARPGVFGSSGNHGSRRNVAEVLAMNAAVDAIKQRLGLGQVVLAGQSGGSTIAAALLTLGRPDIACVVLGSGLLSVVDIEHAHRIRQGIPTSTKALMRVFLYDPTDRLTWIPHQPGRRIFVLGDPTDTRTPFPQQRSFAEHVRALGHHATTIEVAGTGTLMHSVAHLTLPAAGQCARGVDEASIRRLVARAPAPVARAAPPTRTSQLTVR
ncbi:MAG: hypothetical protein R3D68_15305 [Hyphomicrobiaceae bacterium]